jgi:tetratricopeptide (TPR) repeat protein
VREIRTLRSFGGRRLRLDGGASSYQLERDPTAATAVVDLALLPLQQNRYADAIPFLRRALAMAPEYPGLRSDLARALREQASALAREGKQSEADGLLSEARVLSGPPSQSAVGAQRSTTTTLK